MRIFFLLSIFAALLFQGCSTKGNSSVSSGAAQKNSLIIKNSFFDPNSYSGSDIERINAALKDAGSCNGTVRIGKRRPPVQCSSGNGTSTMEERDIWVIDSAILVPGNVRLIIDNTTIKLSNSCRDNMIRSTNRMWNHKTNSPLKNIHITGIGNAVLEGADIPRATGDSGKPLYKPGFIPEGSVSFGTDAGKAGVRQKGDWRNIGILLTKTHDFSIENIRIRDSHSWGISLEACTNGRVRNIEFDSRNGKNVNGQWELFRNQDGLDLRRGCRNILIENITGNSGDDLIALTAISSKQHRPGGNKTISDEDICNITIRNVRGYCVGGHHIIRFLNTRGIKIYNVICDGVIDTSPAGHRNAATIKIGDNNKKWGGVTPLGDTYGIQISNVISYSENPILIAGSLQDSIISNVINHNPQTTPVVYQSGRQNVKNCIIVNTLTGGK